MWGDNALYASALFVTTNRVAQQCERLLCMQDVRNVYALFSHSFSAIHCLKVVFPSADKFQTVALLCCYLKAIHNIKGYDDKRT